MPSSNHQSALSPALLRPPFWLRPTLHACRTLHVGKLTVCDRDGGEYVIRGESDGPHGIIRVESPALFLRLLSRGALGFAEGYMAGEWDSPDLTGLLELAARNQQYWGSLTTPSPLLCWVDRLRHRLRANSRRGSSSNIRYHYDLGNHFYRLWLDHTMTYSAAAFDRDGQALERAQANKFEQMLGLLQARPGSHILEIGCGWGSFALAAARAGHRVTGITLSPSQLEYAQRRVARAGLEDRVELRLQDYRDLKEQFDHVVSIEMFEAVGEAYWQAYFDTVQRSLRPGGRAALQVITIDNGFFPRYRAGTDFIQQYIFPGGFLPAPERFFECASGSGLRKLDATFHGSDYVETLHRWQRRFAEVKPQVTSMGFREHFVRMWDYYLAYCLAGFRTGRIDLMRTVLERP
ncbi:MAG: cyclopropane-fatty-acyl-phospholipid synthase family protein [Gammaproteobacteria bacterium]|nr:cyclopropane-fatty-acyl-phospholipid synthase family protein [Gammaproteobacteria bacterium]